jgi:hypothetical protein
VDGTPLPGHDAVGSLRDDRVVANEHRPDEVVAAVGGLPGQRDRPPHVSFVVERSRGCAGHVHTPDRPSNKLSPDTADRTISARRARWGGLRGSIPI